MMQPGSLISRHFQQPRQGLTSISLRKYSLISVSPPSLSPLMKLLAMVMELPSLLGLASTISVFMLKIPYPVMPTCPFIKSAQDSCCKCKNPFMHPLFVRDLFDWRYRWHS